MSAVYGTNIETALPEYGDAVVIDESRNVRFIVRETYDDAKIPSSWTKVGGVAWRRGKEVLIVNKTNASKAWSSYYRWKVVYGTSLDGNQHTAQLQYASNNGGTWEKATADFTYTASRETELVSRFNEFIATVPQLVSQEFHAVLDGDGTTENPYVINLISKYTAYYQIDYTKFNSGPLSLSHNHITEIPYDSNMFRYNGRRDGYGSISNMDRAISYFSQDQSNTSYNPDSDVTSISQPHYPICKPAYLGTSQYRSDHCAKLREFYGDGEEGWLRFMERHRAVYPSLIGTFGKRGQALMNTQILAGYRYPDVNGTMQIVSPAGDYVSKIGYDAPQMGVGKWFLPDIEQVYEINSRLKYSTNPSRSADPLNDILYRMGGNAILNASSLWSSSRYGVSYAWLTNGSCGYLGNYHMCNACVCVPSLLYQLTNGN